MTNDNPIDLLQVQIDALLDKDFLTLQDKELLNELGNQIVELEKNIEIPDIYGVDILKSLIKDNKLTPLDLVPVLGTMPYVKSILDGTKDLSMDEITALAEFLCVSPSVLLPRKPNDE